MTLEIQLTDWVLFHHHIYSFCSLSYDRSKASSKRVPQEMRFSASPFSFQYPHTSLHLLLNLPITSILPSTFHSIMFFKMHFLCNMWLIQLAFLVFTVGRIFLSSLILCNTSSFSTWSVHLIFSILPPAQHFKTYQVFLIHFLKCPSSNTRQSYAPNVALY